MATKYDSILANDKDLPLIAGYVHAHHGESREALDDFTRALERDPKMATGYVNRGFVLNDLHEAGKAAKIFRLPSSCSRTTERRTSGLAYADLQLHRPKPALAQLARAQKLLGKSHAWHLARAEAFRQEQDFSHAEPEYRIALQEHPNDLPTQLHMPTRSIACGVFQQAIAALDVAQKLASANPAVYALRAQIYAREGGREQTLQNIQLAEQYGMEIKSKS